MHGKGGTHDERGVGRGQRRRGRISGYTGATVVSSRRPRGSRRSSGRRRRTTGGMNGDADGRWQESGRAESRRDRQFTPARNAGRQTPSVRRRLARRTPTYTGRGRRMLHKWREVGNAHTTDQRSTHTKDATASVRLRRRRRAVEHPDEQARPHPSTPCHAHHGAASIQKRNYRQDGAGQDDRARSIAGTRDESSDGDRRRGKVAAAPCSGRRAAARRHRKTDA